MFRAAACGIALDDKQFVFVVLLGGTTTEFSDQIGVGNRVFLACDFFGFACRLSYSGGGYRFADEIFTHAYVLFKKLGETLLSQRFYRRFCFDVAQFGFGLTFKLNVGHLDGQYRSHTLAEVFAEKIGFFVL